MEETEQMQVENQSNNQIQPLPPKLNLVPKLSSTENYHKRMKNKEKFEGCLEDELKNKYKSTEEKDENAFFEDDATGIQIKPNVDGKILCQRCESYFLPQEMKVHCLQHSSQIFDWLYLGSSSSANNEKELTVRTNISYIVNCAYEVLNYFPEQFSYLKIDADDYEKQNIAKFFDETADFIHEAKLKNKNVLVHCIQGISRSSTILIAYLIKYENTNLKEACQFTLQKRSIIRPNNGFLKQLLEFEKQIRQVNSITFEDLVILFQKKKKLI